MSNNRLLIIALCLTLLAGTITQAQSVTAVNVSGGSFLLVPNLDVDPAIVLVSTFSTQPTWVDFEKEPGELVFTLSFGTFNNDLAGTTWQGLDFSIDGGRFLEEPTFLSSATADTLLGAGDSVARVLHPVAPGGNPFVNLELALDSGSPARLTFTPIIPEPGTAALVATTLLLGGRRVRG